MPVTGGGHGGSDDDDEDDYDMPTLQAQDHNHSQSEGEYDHDQDDDDDARTTILQCGRGNDMNDDDNEESSEGEGEADATKKDDEDDDVAASPAKDGGKRKRGGGDGDSSGDEDLDRLEDDDYDLLEENTGIRFKKKFRRVRVLDDDDSDEDIGGNQATARDQIAEELFDLDDDAMSTTTDRTTRVPSASKAYSSDESSEDEIDDFIVDDSGAPIRRRRTGELDVTDERMQNAQDIFGVDFEVGDLDRDLEEDSEGEELASSRAKKTRKPVTLGEIYEPAILQRMHYTQEDIQIRRKDIPERFQRHNVEELSTDDRNVKDLKEEVGWIYEELIKKQNKLGVVYKNDNCEDWSLNFDELGTQEDQRGFQRTLLGRRELQEIEEQGEQSKAPVSSIGPAGSVINMDDADRGWDRDTNVSAVNANTQPDDEDWETPAVSTAGASKSQVAGNTNDLNDDSWETETTVSKLRATQAGAGININEGLEVKGPSMTTMDDDDDWGGPSNPKAVSKDNDDWDNVPPPVHVSVPPPPLSTRSALNDDDDWEKGSVIQGTRMPISAPCELVIAAPSEIGGTKSVRLTAEEAEEALKKKEELCKTIEEILKLMKKELLEVPFIVRYHKDIYRGCLIEKDLWMIYRLDIKYSKLQKSRKALYDMAYTTGQFLEEPQNKTVLESTLGKVYREVTEADLRAIKTCKSFEELSDFRSFYTLHYGKLTPLLKAQREKMKVAMEKERKAWDGENDLVVDLDATPKDDETLESGALLPPSQSMRVIRMSKYEKLLHLLGGFLANYGLTSSMFAENVGDDYMINHPVSCQLEPDEAAQEYLSVLCPLPHHVLESTNYAFATQISREPEIRKAFRAFVFKQCALMVTPTDVGKKTIDEFHMLYTMKYLNNKKIQSFERDDFLKLVTGEQEKLIEVKFSEEFVDRDVQKLIEDWAALFREDGFAGTIHGWNEVRKATITLAVKEFLLPVFLKEVKSQLESDARDFVIRACRRKIRKMISVGRVEPNYPSWPPDNLEEEPEEWNTENGIRIMAVAYDTDPAFAPFACVMSKDGTELIDYIALNNLLFCRPSRRGDPTYQQTFSALSEFILKNKPHAIALGGESVEADYVATFLNNVTVELTNESYDGTNHTFPDISSCIYVIDNAAAKVYSLSKHASAEFGEHPVVLRQAIALARMIDDPLIELGQLFNSEEDILCLNLHTFQSRIGKEELIEEIGEEFVQWTNMVGLDFNECLTDPRKGHMLQFICGLGPAKASFLIRIFRRSSNRLINREKLISVGNLEEVTFKNCAGFIRINVKDLENGSDDGYIEYLDSTRIHPHNYQHSRFMAHSAFNEEESDTPNPYTEEECVKMIFDDPEACQEQIKSLDLVKFAEHIVENGGNWILSTLEDISKELIEPFKDPRDPFQRPSDKEQFSILTKETAQTFYNGKLLMGKVTGFLPGTCNDADGMSPPVRVEEFNPDSLWKCPTCDKADFQTYQDVWSHFDNPRAAFISLDNGLKGILPGDKVSDSSNVDINQRLKLDQAVTCRVLSFKPELRQVRLTTRSSDLQDTSNVIRLPRDPDYDFGRELEDEKKNERSKPRESGAVYHRRGIVHSCFHNITFQECKKRMESMESGDAVFRPSSKGLGRITLSWKVMDGVMQHVDVTETRRQEPGGAAVKYSIGDDEFEDLDEILSRYVYPMALNVRDIVNHKNYVNLEIERRQDQAEMILKEKLVLNPRQLHYVFSPIKERPGYFLLSYLMTTSQQKVKCTHEVIKVVPDGFRFREGNYENMTNLLGYFKRYYRHHPFKTPKIGSASASGLILF